MQFNWTGYLFKFLIQLIGATGTILDVVGGSFISIQFKEAGQSLWSFNPDVVKILNEFSIDECIRIRSNVAHQEMYEELGDLRIVEVSENYWLQNFTSFFYQLNYRSFILVDWGSWPRLWDFRRRPKEAFHSIPE